VSKPARAAIGPALSAFETSRVDFANAPATRGRLGSSFERLRETNASQDAVEKKEAPIEKKENVASFGALLVEPSMQSRGASVTTAAKNANASYSGRARFLGTFPHAPSPVASLATQVPDHASSLPCFRGRTSVTHVPSPRSLAMAPAEAAGLLAGTQRGCYVMAVSSSPNRVRPRPPTAPTKEAATGSAPPDDATERRRRVFADALDRFDEKNARILAELAK
jgi:hypothetical protein